MSQTRVRKAPGGGEANTTRGPIVKAAGDCAPSKPQGQKPDNHRSRDHRTKNKLPKNVQYDLENALVSLCDLWFEDIKPHLVRNNIKLHVEGEAPAGARCRPAVSATCAHDDPASTSGQCELCRLLAQAATSIESAVSQASGAVPIPPPLQLDVAGQKGTQDLLSETENNSNILGQSVRSRGLSDDRLARNLHNRPLFHSQTRPLISTPETSDSIVKRLDSSTFTIPVPREDEYIPVTYLRLKTLEAGIQTDSIPNLCQISSFKRSKTKSKDRKKVAKIGNVANKATSRNAPHNGKAAVQKKVPKAPPKRRKYYPTAPSKTCTSPGIKQSARIKSKAAQNKPKNVSQYRTIYENRPVSPHKEVHNIGRCRSKSPKKRETQSKNRASVKDSAPRRTRTISPATRCPSPDKVTGAQHGRKHIPIPRHHESRLDPRGKGSSPRKTSECPPISESPTRRSTSPRMRGMCKGIQLSQMQPICKRSNKTTSFIHPGCGDKPVRDTPLRNKRNKPRSGRKEKFQMFDNDLTNIIGKQNDKRLELLYRGPTIKESCSTTMLNLYTPTEIQRATAVKPATLKPWR